MTETKVQLFIYDLSNGMAASFGHFITGSHVEAIYHTSLVAFGKEFYFSGGICHDPPYSTAFGNPMKVEEIGTTEITLEDFFAYLKAVESKFTFNTYHIFDNNCNHFTNDVSEFLTGKGIPDYILNQANHYKNTPIGKMLEGFMVNPGGNNNGYSLDGNGGQNNANTGLNNNTGMGFNNNNNGMGLNNNNFGMGMNNNNNNFGMGMSNNNTVPQQQTNSNVEQVNDILKFMEVTQDNDKVIVDFTASWCGPCKMIKPTFHQWATEFKGKVVFVEVDVDKAKDISVNVGVTAMPTFVLYKGGKEVDRLKGANKDKLRECIEKLDKM